MPRRLRTPRRLRIAWKEAARKVNSADRPRPNIPPLVSATLNFANTGIFTAPGDRDAVPPSTHLSVLREYVNAQLEAVVEHGAAVDLDHVDCQAGSVLHEYALEREEELRAKRGAGFAVLPTNDERIAVAVDVVRRQTTLAIEQLRSKLRLRRCENADCNRWFVALDARQVYDSDQCKERNRAPRDRAAYMRNYRQIPKVKRRS